jgi:Thiolase, C-terminal domain
LLGPAYATARLLARNNLTAKDIDAFEYHEAFAGQILANLNALDSDEFNKRSIGLPNKVGRLDMDKFNNVCSNSRTLVSCVCVCVYVCVCVCVCRCVFLSVCVSVDGVVWFDCFSFSLHFFSCGLY